jgi:hypothetical protein
MPLLLDYLDSEYRPPVGDVSSVGHQSRTFKLDAKIRNLFIALGLFSTGTELYLRDFFLNFAKLGKNMHMFLLNLHKGVLSVNSVTY